MENSLQYEIIPGILEKDWEEIEKKIELVRSFARIIHIDIIDGKFADNTTFLDPAPFKKYSSDLFFEVHMMVVDPFSYIQPFARAGFRRFIGHIEHMQSQSLFVTKAEEVGEVGLAIDGPTDLAKIQVPFTDLDCLLSMTITAGKSGQMFNPGFAEKIKTLRSRDEFLPIEVDGGINDETIVDALNFGATRFVSTSFLFSGDPKEQYDKLEKKIDRYLEKQKNASI